MRSRWATDSSAPAPVPPPPRSSPFPGRRDTSKLRSPRTDTINRGTEESPRGGRTSTPGDTVTRAGRKIHPYRTSGRNEPGYSRAPQQPAQAPAPAPSARRRAPARPEDARTVGEAGAGLLRAAKWSSLALVVPRFLDSSGPWIRLGDHECRVPTQVAVRVIRARDGRHIAALAHTDQSATPGRVQILVSTANGVREMVGVPLDWLGEVRDVLFPRTRR